MATRARVIACLIRGARSTRATHGFVTVGKEAMAAKLIRKLPEATRYTKQQLNTWRDFIWGITIGHARDWLSIHNLAPETHEGERSFAEKRPPGPFKGR